MDRFAWMLTNQSSLNNYHTFILNHIKAYNCLIVKIIIEKKTNECKIILLFKRGVLNKKGWFTISHN